MDEDSRRWQENKRRLHARTREYRTVMSEIARLFERVLLKGNEAEREELKLIFSETKARLTDLTDRIERGG